MPLPLPRPSAALDATRLAAGLVLDSAAAVAAMPARALGMASGAPTLPALVVGLPARVLGLPGRVLGLLGAAEGLVARIDAVAGRAETALRRAERVLDEAEAAVRQVGVISTAATAAVEEATRIATAAGVVVIEAQQITGTAAATVARAELITATADELLTAYETTLRKGAPAASRFVEQLSPEEVDAAIRLIDELPRLTHHITTDVLPMLATLDRVGPDIHDLLGVTRELKLAVAGIPGLKLLARRGDRLTDAASAADH